MLIDVLAGAYGSVRGARSRGKTDGKTTKSEGVDARLASEKRPIAVEAVHHKACTLVR